MKKQMLSKHGTLLAIRPDVVRRKMCQTDWWSKKKRIVKEGEEDDWQALTYPIGYVF